MTSIANETEKVVQEMTKNRRVFTAYDVTKVVRHRAPGENVPHSTVRDKVHAIFDNDQMGIYDRTQVRHVSGNPLVFHLSHQDPTNYNADWINQTIQLAKANNVNPIDGAPVTSRVLALLEKVA